VKVKHATCESVSSPISITDTFSAMVMPSGGPFEVCAHEEFYLYLQLPTGGNLTWFYYENDKALTEVLNQQSSEVHTFKTGYYYAQVNKNACVFETDPKHVVVYPSDSVFVPNIFTPNGDIYNPVFQASGAVAEISLQIINRYGKTIFIGDGYKGWDGGDAASGIYFWTVQYPGCRNEPKTKRGTVHLFR
ncbi:MAG: gliding motility-associated C-terminal domain-containing protein, partial [Cyclobacteriaceae bacterium]|nr:gliding motility-associated C-terminal domain-containing protein [Cyclobacteriaceae bacterium]